MRRCHITLPAYRRHQSLMIGQQGKLAPNQRWGFIAAFQIRAVAACTIFLKGEARRLARIAGFKIPNAISHKCRQQEEKRQQDFLPAFQRCHHRLHISPLFFERRNPRGQRLIGAPIGRFDPA